MSPSRDAASCRRFCSRERVRLSQARGERIDRDGLIKSLKTYASLHGFVVDWESVEQAPTETIVNVAAQICPFDPAAKQAMLEAVTLEDRSQALLALLEWDRAAGDDQQRPIQ